MKRIFQTKFISAVMALCMLVTVFPAGIPISVSAATGTAYKDAETIIGGSIYYEIVTADDGTQTVSITDADDTITSAVIPDKIENLPVTVIGSNAFYLNESLTKVVLPEGIKTIDYNAFNGCKLLTEVNFSDSLESIGERAFEWCDIQGEIVFGQNLKQIGNSAFHANDGLTKVTFPDGITTIGSSAFSNCDALAEVNLPDTLSLIDDYAFSNCALTEVTVPTSITQIKNRTFEGNPLTKVTLPDGLTSIGDHAFIDCASLAQITLPETLTSIGLGSFIRTGLTSIEIPKNVTTIGGSAFMECRALTKVTLPEGLTKIENSTFYKCYTLAEVNLPSSLTGIGESAFHWCDLRTAVIPDSVTTIGQNAFYENKNLATVTMPKNLTSIEMSTFNGCSALSEINIPDTIETIGKSAFWGCALKEVTIPNKITEIEDNTFYKNEALTKVTLPEGLTSIGVNAFSACPALKNVNFPSTLKMIAYCAFKSTGLEAADLPDSLVSIDYEAFDDVPNLKELTIPKNVDTLMWTVFKNPNATEEEPAKLTILNPDITFNTRYQDMQIDGVSYTDPFYAMRSYPTEIYAYEVNSNHQDSMIKKYYDQYYSKLDDSQKGKLTFHWLDGEPEVCHKVTVTVPDGATAVITQNDKEINATREGNIYTINKVPEGKDVHVRIHLDGYYSKSFVRSAEFFKEDWNLTVTEADLTKESVLGKLTTILSVKDNAETVNSFDDMTLELTLNGTPLTDGVDYETDYPYIILKDTSNIDRNDKLRLTLTPGASYGIAAASTEIAVKDGTFDIEFPLRGSINVKTSGDKINTVLIFDESGKLISEGNTYEAEYTSSRLVDGNYTVAVFNKNEYFASVATLDALNALGMAEGTDYAKQTAVVSDGQTAQVNLSVPQLGEKDSIINSDRSYVIPDSTKTFVNDQLGIRVYYSLKDETATGTIHVTLPEGVELDYVYSEEGRLPNSTDIAVTKSSGVIFLTVKAEKGEHTISASITSGGVTAPIGSAVFRATDLLIEPLFDYLGNRTDKATMEIRTLPETTVTLLGGQNELTGKTNKAGRLTLDADLPDTAQSGQNFAFKAQTNDSEAETKVTLLEGLVDVTDFGFYYNGKNHILKGNNAVSTPYYRWYWGNKEYTFYATIESETQPVSVVTEMHIHGSNATLDVPMSLIRETPGKDGKTRFEYSGTVNTLQIPYQFVLTIEDAGGGTFSLNGNLLNKQKEELEKEKAEKDKAHTDAIGHIDPYFDWSETDIWDEFTQKEQEWLTDLQEELVQGYKEDITTDGPNHDGTPYTIFAGEGNVFDYVDKYWYEAWVTPDEETIADILETPEDIRTKLKNTLTDLMEQYKELDDTMQTVTGLPEPLRNYNSFDDALDNIGVETEKSDAPLSPSAGKKIETPEGSGIEMTHNEDTGDNSVVITEDGVSHKFDFSLDSLNLDSDRTKQKQRIDEIAAEIKYVEAETTDLSDLYDACSAIFGEVEIECREYNWTNSYLNLPTEQRKAKGVNLKKDLGVNLRKEQKLSQDLKVKSAKITIDPYAIRKDAEALDNQCKEATNTYTQAVEYADYLEWLEEQLLPRYLSNQDCYSQRCIKAVKDEIASCRNLVKELDRKTGFQILDIGIDSIKFTTEHASLGGGTAVEAGTVVLDVAREKNMEAQDFAVESAFKDFSASRRHRKYVCKNECNPDEEMLDPIDIANGNGRDVDGNGGRGGRGSKGRRTGGLFSVNAIIDPSGNVYEALETNPVDGVTATVWMADNNLGANAQKWDATEYDQINPQTTDYDGAYAWDVPTGWWQVRFEKEGYTSTQTDWMEVPPPHLNLKTYMVSTAAPNVTGAGAYSDYIEVLFSQYMDADAALTINGIDGARYEWQNTETAADGKKLSKVLHVNKDGGFTLGDKLSFTLSGGTNYTGTAMTQAYNSGELTVSAKPTQILPDECSMFARAGTTDTIKVTVLDENGDPIQGVKVTAKTNADFLAGITPNELQTDKDGVVNFNLDAKYPGTAEVTFSVEGTSLTRTENLRITTEADRPERPVVTIGSNTFGADKPKENEVTVSKGSKLTITTATEGAKIYYTTNDTCPCKEDGGRVEYTEPITVSEDTYFRIAAYKDGEYSERININVTMSSGGSPGGSGGGVASYTVTFDTNGGSKIDSVKVEKNKTVTKPTNPTKDGYTFDGWYTDKELTSAYDFNTKVTKAITLYAKWSENTTEPNEWQNPFTDVTEKDWFYDSVKYSAENGLMNGTSDTTFAPNDNLTRAMLVTILYRAEGEPAVNKSIPFNDVDMGGYYANAVIWAKQNKIVEGYSETEFAPNANITREQIAAILYRYAIYKGMDAVNLSENLGFADADTISEYAISALNWAVGAGLIKGYEDNTVRPQNNATRAEAAAILQRFIEANK